MFYALAGLVLTFGYIVCPEMLFSFLGGTWLVLCPLQDIMSVLSNN